MANISSKRLISKLADSPATYVVLVILGFVFVYSAIGAFRKSRFADEKLNTAMEELQNLEDQKYRLSAELENANTPYGEEKALREKFNVVKDGEQVIMIVNEEGQKEDAFVDEKPEKNSWFSKNRQ
jgi:cell division protein FtsB